MSQSAAVSELSFITRILEPAGRTESKNRKASDYIASSTVGAFTVKKKDITKNNGNRSQLPVIQFTVETNKKHKRIAENTSLHFIKC